MAQKTKQIIIVIVVIAVAFIGFKMFFTSSDSSDVALTSETSSNPEFIDGQMILALLNNLNKVTLDDSVFSNKVFLSLENFERELEPQISGRQNPFLPIGVESSGVILPLSTSTSSVR